MKQTKKALWSGVVAVFLSSMILAVTTASGWDSGFEDIKGQEVLAVAESTLPQASIDGSSSLKVNENKHIGPGYWNDLKDKVALLEDTSFMPVLLPIIMKNRDALQLSKEQLQAFHAWRQNHLQDVLDKMSMIVEQRIAFKMAALDPATPEADLIQLQDQIAKLHREVLILKMSCRAHMVETFTEEQWDSFKFILSEHPKLASFVH